MKPTRRRMPFSSLMFIIFFYGLIILIAVEAFRSGWKSALMLVLVSIMILVDYTIKNEWNFLHSNPNFISMDGAIGVLDSTLIPLHGGRVRCTITTKKSYVPKEKWYRQGGLNGFFAHLSNKVSIDIEDKESMFLVLKQPDLAAPEGAVIYLGSIAGRKIKQFEYHLQERIDFLESILSKISTIYEKSKHISNLESNVNTQNLQSSMASIGTVLKQIKDVPPPQQNMPTMYMPMQK